MFEVLYFIQGPLILSLRMCEFEFRKAFFCDLKYYRALLCQRGPVHRCIDNDGPEPQPIYLFLNSQLNVELVYVILQGIGIMNKSAQAEIMAFGDMTVMDELKRFKVK